MPWKPAMQIDTYLMLATIENHASRHSHCSLLVLTETEKRELGRMGGKKTVRSNDTSLLKSSEAASGTSSIVVCHFYSV